jgi:hypothetical protein
MVAAAAAAIRLAARGKKVGEAVCMALILAEIGP